MAKLSLEVPSEVVDAVKLPPAEVEEELRKELALALYQRGVLALGKARILARMTRWQFEQIPRRCFGTTPITPSTTRRGGTAMSGWRKTFRGNEGNA